MWSYFSVLQKTSFLQHVWLRAIYKKQNCAGAPCHSLDFWVVSSCTKDIFPQIPFRLHKRYCLNQTIFQSKNHINNILMSHGQRAEKCHKTVAFSSYLVTTPAQRKQWTLQQHLFILKKLTVISWRQIQNCFKHILLHYFKSHVKLLILHLSEFKCLKGVLKGFTSSFGVPLRLLLMVSWATINVSSLFWNEAKLKLWVTIRCLSKHSYHSSKSRQTASSIFGLLLNVPWF